MFSENYELLFFIFQKKKKKLKIFKIQNQKTELCSVHLKNWKVLENLDYK